MNRIELNKIYNQDIFEFLKLCPDSFFDLIIADPPYGLKIDKWGIDIVNDELVDGFYRILKDTGNLYVFCGIGEKSNSLLLWLPLFQKKFIFKDLITWKKTRGIGMKKGWLYCREEIMWFVKNNKKFSWNEKEQYSSERRKFYGFYLNGLPLSQRMKSEYKRFSNVWTDIMEVNFYNSKEFRDFYKLHFTPKPVKLFERIIRCSSEENDKVLDAFSGSGGCAIACLRLKRNFVSVEKNPVYYQIIQKRIENELKQTKLI